MKKTVLALCFLLSLCLLCGCQATKGVKTAQVVLFGDELLGDQRDFLLRWESPILLAFEDVPAEEQADVLGFLAEAAGLAPHLPQVSVAGDEAEANVVIVYRPYADLKEMAGPNFGLCRYEYADQEMTGARIWIASDTTTWAQRRHLIREEMLHALGLTCDQDDDSTSLLFSGWTETTELSSLDRELLAFLYGDAAYSGMNVSEFRKTYGK